MDTLKGGYPGTVAMPKYAHIANQRPRLDGNIAQTQAAEKPVAVPRKCAYARFARSGGTSRLASTPEPPNPTASIVTHDLGNRMIGLLRDS